MTRDNVIWLVTIAGAAAGYVSAHFDRFPFIGPDYQGVVELAAFLAATASGVAMASPLRHSAAVADPVFDWKKLFGK